jgi:glycosyltransferase involved in cell wall biosynthesis
MKLSIIIATYNSSDVIENCLNSILEQTFKDFEVIVIDGASDDDTLEKVLNLIPNCKWVSEKDQGIYYALNKGLKMSVGEWCYILGSDDLLYDRFTLEVFMKMCHNKFGMVYGDILAKRYEIGKYIKMCSKPAYLSKGYKTPPIFHQSVFIRTEIIKNLGGFPENYLIHSDHLIISAVFNNFDIFYHNRVVCIYSQNGYSALSFSKFFSSSKELYRISCFYNQSSFLTIKVLLKNFVGLILGSFKTFFGK